MENYLLSCHFVYDRNALKLLINKISFRFVCEKTKKNLNWKIYCNLTQNYAHEHLPLIINAFKNISEELKWNVQWNVDVRFEHKSVNIK